MKSFDDFRDYINRNKDIQNKLKNSSLDLTNINPDSIADLMYAFEKSTLDKAFILLRSYHEWINEN